MIAFKIVLKVILLTVAWLQQGEHENALQNYKQAFDLCLSLGKADDVAYARAKYGIAFARVSLNGFAQFESVYLVRMSDISQTVSFTGK